jgi:glycosyltransferase involved in cell wall biosynthesis
MAKNMERTYKKIGYLSGSPRASTRPESIIGAPRSHILGVIKAFENLGWKVQPFIVGDHVPLGWVTASDFDVPNLSKLKRFLADMVRLVMSYFNGWRARFELKDVDLVYERFGSMQILGWRFKQVNIPWILETNSLFYYESTIDRQTMILSSLAKKIEEFAYRNCDVLVCISESLKKMVVDKLGIDPGKIIVVPNGVDTDIFNPELYKAKRIFSGPTIGFIGSLVGWKALDLLIESIAELREEKIFYNLVVIGEGLKRQAWEELVADLKLSSQVSFMGSISWLEVPKYIQGFDLGYSGQIPTKIGEMYDSPLKIYEYMAMACPVVASAYADAISLLEDKGTGYLFVPNDKQSLKDVLRTAYTEQKKWPEMGLKARTEIVQNYSWTSRIQKMIPEMESILKKNKPINSSGDQA